MPEKLIRQTYTYGPVTLNSTQTGASSTFRIPLSQAAGAIIQVISTTGTTPTITWYAAASSDTAVGLHLLKDAAGSNVTQAGVAANVAFAVPDALFASNFAVPVMAASTTASVYITVKG